MSERIKEPRKSRHPFTQRDPIQELAYLFRSSNTTQPVILLGAGASFRSGIPLADEAVKRIARASYAWSVLGRDEEHCNPLPSDWMPYLESREWFISDEERLAENFPLAVEHLLIPREQRRKFLQRLVQAPNGVTDGYRALAQLILRRLCWTVLTANFDTLLCDALRELSPHVRDIVEINKSGDDLVRFGVFNQFQIVYLHGAVEFYRDLAGQHETHRLSDNVVAAVRPLLRDCPLIVVGYRGAEASIMTHLLEEGIGECQKYKNGIYWCRLRDHKLHPKVETLKSRIGSNFHEVEISGFDELTQQLNSVLADDFRHTGEPVALRERMIQAGRWDHDIIGETGIADLDRPLILSTLTQYYQELHLGAFREDRLTDLLLELGLISNSAGKTQCTNGGYLLFGSSVPKFFPYAQVAVTISNRRKVVFEGNLLTQYRNLIDFLNSEEINPLLRVKAETGSHEARAYPARALRELTVNLLMHRDYRVQHIANINIDPGEKLTFTNPGGLMPEVLSRLNPSSDGKFTPTRGVTSQRNPMLADIFYGLGRMDKAGSGLVDVTKWMIEQGGLSEFLSLADNTSVSAVLRQPAQEQPDAATAVPLTIAEVFTTNLLPFLVMPECLYFIPLKYKRSRQRPVDSEALSKLPIFIYQDECVISFADPELFACYPTGELLFDRTRSPAIEDIVSDEDTRRLLVWLLHKHWSFYLRDFAENGLRVNPKEKRAYFCLISGSRNEISYTSRLGRRVKRAVVKQRGLPEKPWYENEGIYYHAEDFKGEWALQIKPMYVFTGLDGREPLPPSAQARRATRRFKFDRNKSVDDDLTFWVRYLSQGEPVISIGGLGVENLILNSTFSQVEVPSRAPEDRKE
jgi:hypothetical protein